MSDLEALARLAPPPPHPPRVDWPAAERELATSLPADYRALADRYGAGSFAGLGLLVPGHPNRHLDLLRQVEPQRGALRDLAERGVEHPHSPDELLPWAIDENGNVAWWWTRPGDWPVVANEARGPEWLCYDGGVVGFLVGVLAGRIDPGFLTMAGDPPFEPFPYA